MPRRERRSYVEAFALILRDGYGVNDDRELWAEGGRVLVKNHLMGEDPDAKPSRLDRSTAELTYVLAAYRTQLRQRVSVDA